MLTGQFLGSYPAKSYAFAFVLSIIHLHCEILPETVLDLVGCCEVVFLFPTNSEIICDHPLQLSSSFRTSGVTELAKIFLLFKNVADCCFGHSNSTHLVF